MTGTHAFPFVTPLTDVQHVEMGMDLRTYIATACLASIVSFSHQHPKRRDGSEVKETAKFATRYADALIAELNR